jgi:hypothetical protein
VSKPKVDRFDIMSGDKHPRRLCSFPDTEIGTERARQYIQEYNDGLMKRLDLTSEDLTRTGLRDYDLLRRIDTYVEHLAYPQPVHPVEVVKDEDPMPEIQYSF